MRVALYQCMPLPLNITENLQRLSLVAQQNKGIDLLVLPEMFLTGYNIGAAAVARLAQTQDGDAARQIAELAKACNMAIAYGYPERDEHGDIYNSVQLIDANGQRLLNYRKTHLFSELDKNMFCPGPDAFPVIELNGWKLGMLICYDLEFPENARRLVLAGAELIVVPTANMEPFEFIAEVTVRSRAFENQCYVAYANYCGHESKIRYCGLSSIAAPDGQQVALAERVEVLICATLDHQALIDAKAANDYLLDRRPELYRALCER